MSKINANPAHQVAYDDLADLLRKHAGEVSAIELLAIAANMLGKMVALQDQRIITPAMAMETVARNIEIGNQQALAQLMTPKGRA